MPPDSVVVLSVNWKTVGRDADLKRLIKGEDIESLLRRLTVSGFAGHEFIGDLLGKVG